MKLRFYFRLPNLSQTHCRPILFCRRIYSRTTL